MYGHINNIDRLKSAMLWLAPSNLMSIIVFLNQAACERNGERFRKGFLLTIYKPLNGKMPVMAVFCYAQNPCYLLINREMNRQIIHLFERNS